VALPKLVERLDAARQLQRSLDQKGKGSTPYKKIYKDIYLYLYRRQRQWRFQNSSKVWMRPESCSAA